MIRGLRSKFLIIIMTLLTLVVVLLVVSLNVIMTLASQNQNREQLQSFITPNGQLNEAVNILENSDRYIVFLDEEQNVLETVKYGYISFTDEEMMEKVNIAIQSNRPTGTIDEMIYLVAQNDDGSVVAFLDVSVENNLLSRLLFITIVIGSTGILAMFAISFWLSAWLIEPVEKAFESQRRFIADASHELKTPIATISANTDLLIEQYGEVKWLGFIKAETKRMHRLVADLLYLASNERDRVSYNMTSFCISDMVALTSMSFEGKVYEEGKKLVLDITPDLSYMGDEDRLKQVVAILVDNAIKHTELGGEITISLSKLQNRLLLTVKNTGKGIAVSEREKIFERFYRSDAARERSSGGYGLGLPIALSIVAGHKGKITAGGEVGSYAEFKVIL